MLLGSHYLIVCILTWLLCDHPRLFMFLPPGVPLIIRWWLGRGYDDDGKKWEAARFDDFPYERHNMRLGERKPSRLITQSGTSDSAHFCYSEGFFSSLFVTTLRRGCGRGCRAFDLRHLLLRSLILFYFQLITFKYSSFVVTNQVPRFYILKCP